MQRVWSVQRSICGHRAGRSSWRANISSLGLILVALLMLQPPHSSSAAHASRRLWARPVKKILERGSLASLKVRFRESSQQKATVYNATQIEAVEKPMTVAIMTHHYFGSEYGRDVSNCSLEEVPLNCSFFPKAHEPLLGDMTELSRDADAVWWHAPNTCYVQGSPWGNTSDSGGSRFKARHDQLAVIASMESSAYYKCLDDAAFMSQFDVEMTYRRKSAIPLVYWGEGYKETWERMPPLPLREKKDAVVYINSNCQTPSGRNLIVADLQRQAGIRVDALGGCLSTGLALPRGAGTKFETFRQYKFCIAMENSVAEDYVSEKVYDALAAGCLPIYLGAPNIVDFIPTSDSIIDYAQLGSPEALAAELLRLSGNESAYEEKMQWRGKPESWGANFVSLIHRSKNSVHSQCQLCQVIARHRLHRLDNPGIRHASNRISHSTNSTMQQPSQSSLIPHLPAQRLKIKYKLSAAPATMEEVVNR